MNRTLLCVSVMIASASLAPSGLSPQEPQHITLNPPDKTRGLPFMEALAVKASATAWSDQELALHDLSDLLWAANGLNRPEENKTTASSAMNAHDVDIYVFMKAGVFVYDFRNHQLVPVASGDLRSAVLMQRPPRPGAEPPAPSTVEAAIQLVLISDAARFRAGSDEQKYEWGAMDAGIVSQNISLFCAATGLKTRPRAMMNKEKITEVLRLRATQHVFLNHPVGYPR
jgi:SagB-type dehydrogenase family enzyme